MEASRLLGSAGTLLGKGCRSTSSLVSKRRYKTGNLIPNASHNTFIKAINSNNMFQRQQRLQASPLLMTQQPARGKAQAFNNPMHFKNNRCGLVGKKLGMIMDWDSNHFVTPLTVVQIENAQVVRQCVEERDGYYGVVIGARDYFKYWNLKNRVSAFYKKIGLHPKKKEKMFRVAKKNMLPVGATITAKHFLPGQFVDVQGLRKGKGFLGVMQRWGFKGGPASHGSSLFHRRPGSSGQLGIAKVMKGKKLPGRVGKRNAMVGGVEVFKIDTRLNLIFLKGQIPGSKGSFVNIRDSMFHKIPQGVPYPTYMEGMEYPLPEDEYGEIKIPDRKKYTLQ